MKTVLLSGNNSVVECDLAKVDVAASKPPPRSKYFGGGDVEKDNYPGLKAA
jgi:hypothetical protein